VLRGELIFIHDGEGGRGDDILDAQLLADGFDEGGLAGSHLAVEGEDGVLAYLTDELTGCLANLAQVLNLDFHISCFCLQRYEIKLRIENG